MRENTQKENPCMIGISNEALKILMTSNSTYSNDKLSIKHLKYNKQMDSYEKHKTWVINDWILELKLPSVQIYDTHYSQYIWSRS